MNMAQANVKSDLPNHRFSSLVETMESPKQTYGLPENYNPADYPAVKLRNNNNRSETDRKRRSKNRLSNRRSTGFVNKDLVDEAFRMGLEGECAATPNQ